jgi:antitoxin component of MazEF toxin-antitoxin module
MKTQIKQWGDSLVIILNKDFLKFNNLSVGDWVDISDIVKLTRRLNKNEMDK